MEHVAAPLGSWPRSLQEVINPAWRWMADGCQVNRWVAPRRGCCSSVHDLLLIPDMAHVLLGEVHTTHSIDCRRLHPSRTQDGCCL